MTAQTNVAAGASSAPGTPAQAMPERTARRIQPEKDFTILRALRPYFGDIPCYRLGNRRN